MPARYTVQSRFDWFFAEGGRSKYKMQWNCSAQKHTTQLVKYPRVLSTKHRIRCIYFILSSPELLMFQGNLLIKYTNDWHDNLNIASFSRFSDKKLKFPHTLIYLVLIFASLILTNKRARLNSFSKQVIHRRFAWLYKELNFIASNALHCAFQLYDFSSIHSLKKDFGLHSSNMCALW